MNCFSDMYSKLPNLVFGFHGCNKEARDNVLLKSLPLEESKNDYDWLGNGIYFWENSYERAFDWAKNKYDDPYVIGAVIDLGLCLNLTDYQSSEMLKAGYNLLKQDCERAGKPLPRNKQVKQSRDWLLRDLDCAVIGKIHDLRKERKFPAYDSVRGVFTEGGEVYKGSGFQEKTHIQICVVNPNCIKGYFEPIKQNENYKLP